MTPSSGTALSLAQGVKWRKKIPFPAQQMESSTGMEEEESGEGQGEAGESSAGELGRMAKSVGAWQYHKEPWLSIQLGSTPLWQTCHQRLCLHGSVHYWEPQRKQRMRRCRCDVYDEQLPYYVAFAGGVYSTLKWQKLQHFSCFFSHLFHLC